MVTNNFYQTKILCYFIILIGEQILNKGFYVSSNTKTPGYVSEVLSCSILQNNVGYKMFVADPTNKSDLKKQNKADQCSSNILSRAWYEQKSLERKNFDITFSGFDFFSFSLAKLPRNPQWFVSFHVLPISLVLKVLFFRKGAIQLIHDTCFALFWPPSPSCVKFLFIITDIKANRLCAAKWIVKKVSLKALSCFQTNFVLQKSIESSF